MLGSRAGAQERVHLPPTKLRASPYLLCPSTHTLNPQPGVLQPGAEVSGWASFFFFFFGGGGGVQGLNRVYLEAESRVFVW